MKNNLPTIKAKAANIEALLALFPDPTIFCHITELGFSGEFAGVGFFPPEHKVAKATLGPDGWVRVIDSEKTHFDWVRIMAGVCVTLYSVERIDLPMDGTLVNTRTFFGDHPATDPSNVAPAILAAATSGV